MLVGHVKGGVSNHKGVESRRTGSIGLSVVAVIYYPAAGFAFISSSSLGFESSQKDNTVC